MCATCKLSRQRLFQGHLQIETIIASIDKAGGPKRLRHIAPLDQPEFSPGSIKRALARPSRSCRLSPSAPGQTLRSAASSAYGNPCTVVGPHRPLPPQRLFPAGNLTGANVPFLRAFLQLDVGIGILVPDRELRRAAREAMTAWSRKCLTRIGGVLRSFPDLVPTVCQQE